MTRYAKKTDANHADIRDGLKALGWEVLDTSGIGQGVPDLLSDSARGGRWGWRSSMLTSRRQSKQ